MSHKRVYALWRMTRRRSGAPVFTKQAGSRVCTAHRFTLRCALDTQCPSTREQHTGQEIGNRVSQRTADMENRSGHEKFLTADARRTN